MLCDGRYVESVVIGGVWRVLCDGRYVEKVLCDGRYVERVLCDGGMWRECCVMVGM